MKIVIGSDHAGYSVKQKIKKLLEQKNIDYEDVGTYSTKPVDYPDYAKKVAKKISKGKNMQGILVCGTGTGMAIVANKFKGIRAVAAPDTYSARMARHDNDSNVLCLRARGVSFKHVKNVLLTWLKTPFSNIVRHKRRVDKIKRIEKNKK